MILAFWWGGNAPGTRGFLPQPETEVNEIIEEPEQNESSEKVQEDVPANVNEKTENNPDANVPEKTEEIKEKNKKQLRIQNEHAPCLFVVIRFLITFLIFRNICIQ